MTMTISRRGLARIISFALAICVVLGASAWTARRDAETSRLALEYRYMQSVADLATYVQNIDTSLQKAMYAKSPAMLSQLSSKLWREAGFAKDSLDALPIEYLSLQNTNKLLSQVGDYCTSLAKDFANGKPITPEQRQNLETLRQYCGQMLQDVYAVSDGIQTGSISFASVKADVQQNMGNEPAAPTLAEGFSEFEEGFTAYPTLIYDGPFSDHIMQKDPEYLKSETNVSRAVAQKRAASLLGVAADKLADAGDEEGRMPSYGFSAEGADISLTKQGGCLSYLLRHRELGDRAVPAGQAVQNARAFLSGLRLPEMRATYYELSGSVLTINFAAVQDGVLLYPDLIKVGVALDNGEVLSFDGRGFLTNHTSRAGLAPALTADEARASVSEVLAVEGSQLCLIPSGGLNEVLCWEFKCRDGEQQVLVYVNAQTGAEEQILLLLIDENGQLTI